MPFLPNIPQSTDQLSVSQGNILNNFQILGAIAGNGAPASASINSASGFNWVYIPHSAAAPPAGAAFPVDEIGIYSAENSKTGLYELYVNKQSLTGAVQVPMTASSLSTTSPSQGGAGWSYLPSGFILQWGGMANPGLSPKTITFPTPFPNTAIVVLATAKNNASQFYATGTITQTNFVIASNTGTIGDFQWMAIGW